MNKELTVPARKSGMTLFGKAKAALEEVGIDLEAIVETHAYFLEQQKQDPDLTIPTYRTKMPSGGGKSFEIKTGDEDFDAVVQTFRGVIAAYHNCNVRFLHKDDGGKMTDPPLCQSPDGISGTCAETGELIVCADCPYNQWGSARSGGKGKECKNVVRLYILAEGCDIPIVMTLPPTSKKGWNNYKSATLGVQRLSPQEVVTEFSLSSMVSGGGDPYSVVQFKAAGTLSSEMRVAVKALGRSESYSKEMSGDDYNVADAETARSVGVDVEADDDE